MTSHQLPSPKKKAYNNFSASYGEGHAMEGAPLAGGVVFVFIGGSSQLARVFSDPEMLVALPNPFILDGYGEARVFVDKDDLDVSIKCPMGTFAQRYSTK